MPASIAASPRAVTRRAVLAGGALAAPALRAAPVATGTLGVTAYDGFVPPAFRQQFEAETGARLRIRLAASQAPELSLLVTERDHPLTDICTVTGTPSRSASPSRRWGWTRGRSPSCSAMSCMPRP